MTNTITKTRPPEQLTLPGMSKEELARLESTIKQGLKSFMQVGHALQQIRDKRGFLLKGYKTFEAYCEKEFQFSLRHGERMMLAAQTSDTVKRITGEAPANEAVARVLTSVAKDEGTLKKVARELKLSGKTFATATAEKVADVVTRVTSRTKGNGKDPGPTPAEKAAAPLLQSLSDACPSCHATPEIYQHRGGGYHCGACGSAVRLNAIAVEIVLCKDCGKPIVGDAGYCTRCGSVQ